MKKFTVSVLTYKRNELLWECLKSLLRMSIRPNEILIIDQNPTDKLKNKIARLAAKNKDIVFTHIFMGEAHVAKGRKKALEKARYDYLLFTDDDCRVDKEWALHALRMLNTSHPLVAGKCLRDKRADTLVARTLHEQTEHFFSHYETAAKGGHILSYLMDSKNCALDRRSILKKKITYNPRQFWLEDVDFSFQAYMKKIPIMVEKKMIVTHTYVRTIPQAMQLQFRLGYTFVALLRRWRSVPEVRALIAYASQKDMQNKRKGGGLNPLVVLFSLTRSAGYLFGTIRSFYSGRSSDG